MSHESISWTAKLNTRVMRKLEKALAANPEVDLFSVFPSSCSDRIAKGKKIATNNDILPSQKNTLPMQDEDKLPSPPKDVRRLLAPNDATIIVQLADSVQELVKSRMTSMNASTIDTEAQFFVALAALLQDAEVVYLDLVPLTRIVVKCGVDAVAKLVWREEDFTEYSTLQYLLEHKPSIPAPRPLGLVRMGPVLIMFSSYMPGLTLEEAWPQLAADHKASVRDQLDAIFRDLRTIPFPHGMLLGGVENEGCKDQRRNLRRSPVPIFNIENFQTFQFSGAKYGSMTFIDYLRAFTPQTSKQIVFTHDDLRPANVIVELTEDQQCIVTGIIDWEDSGFYPAYYEATKITNCLATNEDWDWYYFLPPCISSHSHRVEWLLDYVWGRHLE